MHDCCPRGHGCNAPDGSEPCALEVFRAASDELEEAELALERWTALDRACEHRGSNSERRFRKRAYERTRDRALVALALHGSAMAAAG